MEDTFSEFLNGCHSQWKGGGKRYALEEDKEYTDLICETAGNIWIGGNILKYAGEVYNAWNRGDPVPEVDFFKIAVYAFIWWLKEFRHPTTGIRLKQAHWGEFIDGVDKIKRSQNRISYGGQAEHLLPYDHYQYYINMVEKIKTSDSYDNMHEAVFFQIGYCSYQWWLKEYDNFTQRDEGEEFEK